MHFNGNAQVKLQQWLVPTYVDKGGYIELAVQISQASSLPVTQYSGLVENFGKFLNKTMSNSLSCDGKSVFLKILPDAL